jgi:hypothetical protein
LHVDLTPDRNALTGNDDVERGDFDGEVGDRVGERKNVWRAIDHYIQRHELGVGLLGHTWFTDAGDDLKIVALRVEMFGEEANFRFFAADHEPPEDE